MSDPAAQDSEAQDTANLTPADCFITEAYAKGVRGEDIMRHTRHRDLRTMRGYVRLAGLIYDSPG